MAYEILKEMGSFGLVRDLSSSEIVIPFGDGYYSAYSYGLPQGTLSWKLVLNYLPQGGTTIPNAVGQNLNRLDYILDFYNRNKTQGTVPFILLDTLDGKRYLARFSGPSIPLTMIGQRFWRGSGLDIEQARLPGVSDSGDPLSTPNPVSI